MKPARAIGQGGRVLTHDVAAMLRYPLEMQLARDPGRAWGGERVTFGLLHKRHRNPALRVYVGAAAQARSHSGHVGATLMHTATQGEAPLALTPAGTCYIHANRLGPSAEASSTCSPTGRR